MIPNKERIKNVKRWRFMVARAHVALLLEEEAAARRRGGRSSIEN